MGVNVLQAAKPANLKTKAERKMEIFRLLAVASLLAFVCVFIVHYPVAHATNDVDTAIDDAVEVMVTVLRVICIALGGFLILFGIVKTIMAHAQDNAAEQNKSLVQAASGLALVIMGIVLLDTLKTPIASIIKSASTVKAETGP